MSSMARESFGLFIARHVMKPGEDARIFVQIVPG